MATYSNSKLVDYTRYSPNHSGKKKQPITRISPHCVVGQVSVERLGEIFAPTYKEASSNYGIGYDGRVGMYVEEKNHSWCTSSWYNDDRAVTIEVASDSYSPYRMNEAAYEKLIDLCVDICKRYGKKKLLWLKTKTATDKHTLKDDEMLLTIHKWYANKACPGAWLEARLGDLAKKTTERLTAGTNTAKQTNKKTNAKTTAQKNTASTTKRKVKATGYATSGPLKSLVGTYTITAEDGLNMRHRAGTAGGLMVAVPYKKQVQCYGFYSMVGNQKWLYVVYYDEDSNTEYTGFMSGKYLKKKK